jgi:co-chaperonin GroES (HSP10)
MSKISLLGTLVGVEELKNSNKESTGAFVLPEMAENLGIVRYVGEGLPPSQGPLRVGDKVYFGSKRETVRMKGVDILIMEYTNVIGIVEEEAAQA